MSDPGEPKAIFYGVDWGGIDWTSCRCPRCNAPHRWRKRWPKHCRECGLAFRWTANEVDEMEPAAQPRSPEQAVGEDHDVRTIMMEAAQDLMVKAQEERNALQAEVWRLRDALRPFANMTIAPGDDLGPYYIRRELVMGARAALAASPEPPVGERSIMAVNLRSVANMEEKQGRGELANVIRAAANELDRLSAEPGATEGQIVELRSALRDLIDCYSDLNIQQVEAVLDGRRARAQANPREALRQERDDVSEAEIEAAAQAIFCAGTNRDLSDGWKAVKGLPNENGIINQYRYLANAALKAAARACARAKDAT